MVGYVLLQLAALIAIAWMFTGIVLLLVLEQYPIQALVINSVSIIGICIVNAYQATRSKKNA